MSKHLKIKVPCSEANHVCDKSQYNEASLWEKIKLNIHLLYCKACRDYTNNNKKLSQALKKSKVSCMDHKRKACMKEEFEKALKDQTK